MKACEYFLNKMHVNKIEDEYFADHMVIYIEKKLTEKLNYNSITMS